MKHISVGIFHDENLGKELAKKGTESDILMFNRKTDDCVFTFLSPVDDKLIPKTQIISSIDAAIVSCENITSSLGETILMLNSIGVSEGILVLPEFYDENKINSLIKDTSLENFQIISRDTIKIMDIISKQEPARDISSPGVVIVDHSFSVKGVGEVILGFVKQGVVHKHEKMILLPTKKQIVIRSIQMQDKDYDEAFSGCRVGLLIKGATVEEMRRGAVFTAENGAAIDNRFNLKFIKNPFYSNLKEGLFHLTVNMQSTPAKIISVNDDEIAIETEKTIAYSSDDVFILFDLNASKLHYIGKGRIKS